MTSSSDGGAEQGADTGGQAHRERAPERHASRPRHHRAPPTRAATLPSSARNTSDAPPTTGIRLATGTARDGDQRHGGTDGKTRRRGERRLDRPRAQRLRDAELVARVRPSASCAISWSATCLASAGSRPRPT